MNTSHMSRPRHSGERDHVDTFLEEISADLPSDLDLTVEGGIGNPKDFGAQLKQVTGVVEQGLFVGMTDTVIVAGPEGPKAIGRLSGGAVARPTPRST